MWCFVFGIGALIWGQIVTSIPTEFVKFLLCMKKKTVEENSDKANAPEAHIEEKQEELSKSKILWIHGIRRIQYQLSVISAFRSRIEEARSFGSLNSIQNID